MDRDASAAAPPLIATAPALAARVEALGHALRARAWRMATAESCTGGLIAGTCTAVAGSSDWFEAGFVTYGNAAKRSLLDVPGADLEQHGAVSAEVAAAMARGARRRAAVDLAVAVTGIAGPGGGSPAKPVGTVWLALAWPEDGGERVATECLHLAGDRAQIRSRTVEIALDRLLLVARGTEPDTP